MRATRANRIERTKEREGTGEREKEERGSKDPVGPTAAFREPRNYTVRLPRRRGVKIVLSSPLLAPLSTVLSLSISLLAREIHRPTGHYRN